MNSLQEISCLITVAGAHKKKLVKAVRGNQHATLRFAFIHLQSDEDPVACDGLRCDVPGRSSDLLGFLAASLFVAL